MIMLIPKKTLKTWKETSKNIEPINNMTSMFFDVSSVGADADPVKHRTTLKETLKDTESIKTITSMFSYMSSISADADHVKH